MSTPQPYTGNPNPMLCESLDDALLLRHISYCPGIEPQLYLVEQCVHKRWGCPSMAGLAAGINQFPIWREYWELNTATTQIEGED